MVTQPTEVREQQRSAWNRFSAGWKKNDILVGRWLEPVGQQLLKLVALDDGYLVLDAATGTGEPGLSAARQVGSGTVIGSDIAADMLAIAQEKARAAGIRNYETNLSDETALPFPTDHFDAVLCRFGVMYFPDPQAAVAELSRVLKPGKKLALSTWAQPAKNAWATSAAKVVNPMLGLPPAPAHAPGLFRSAEPGSLTGLLAGAGLHAVTEAEVSGTLKFGSAERYWEFITDVVAPIAAALSKSDEATRQNVKQAVLHSVRAEHGSGPIGLSWSAWVAAGTK